MTEPLDPKTHMGFVKLNLWLAVEYTKVGPAPVVPFYYTRLFV